MTYVVYRFYGADGRLLYVGCAGSSVRRWMEHARYQPWWLLAVSCTLTHYPDAETALAAEAEAIRTEEPLYNTLHTPRNRRAHLGGYRPKGAGSLYIQKRNMSWNASIRHGGKRHRFYGGPGEEGRLRAEALLEAFRQEHGVVAREPKWPVRKKKAA